MIINLYFILALV